MILEMENSPRSSIPWKLSSSSAPTERISASGTILGDSIVVPSVELGKGRFVINLTLFTHKVNNYVGHMGGNECKVLQSNFYELCNSFSCGIADVSKFVTHVTAGSKHISTHNNGPDKQQ